MYGFADLAVVHRIHGSSAEGGIILLTVRVGVYGLGAQDNQFWCMTWHTRAAESSRASSALRASIIVLPVMVRVRVRVRVKCNPLSDK